MHAADMRTLCTRLHVALCLPFLFHIITHVPRFTCFLQAHLGFKNFPIPRFAAHIVFELHEIDGRFFVKAL